MNNQLCPSFNMHYIFFQSFFVYISPKLNHFVMHHTHIQLAVMHSCMSTHCYYIELSELLQLFTGYITLYMPVHCIAYVYHTTVFPRSNAAATNFFLPLKLAAIIRGRRLLEGGDKNYYCIYDNMVFQTECTCTAIPTQFRTFHAP